MILPLEEIEKRVNDSYELPNNVSKGESKPIVSIRTSTYQHGKYIKDCIEGVLMQKTDFPIEFIIGEDFSTDGTREIVFEYAEKYPDVIRVITADYNVGSKANGERCIRAAQGEYMAICEGDDYWTDSLKLQKQMDILQKYPKLAMVTHEANHQSEIADIDRTFRRFVSIFFRDHQMYGWRRVVELLDLCIKNRDDFWKQKRTADSIVRKEFNYLHDFADNTWYMPMCSIFMKREVIESLPECHHKTVGGHQKTLLLGAMKGGIYHIPEIMAVKRDQETSISKNKEHKRFLANQNKVPEKSNLVKRYQCLKECANEEQKLILDQMIEKYISDQKSRS